MIKKCFDVIIVPDFAGSARDLFEIRTLFFLASWLEFGGLTKYFPLHLACIGQAPKSVVTLGKRCNALFTTHKSVHEIRFLNKLRGLEIEGLTKHALLLDVDILLLGDISKLASLLPQNCISADTADSAHISKTQWETVYSDLKIPCPEPNMETVNWTIGAQMQAPNYNESSATYPYYNSGILFFPWDCNLRTTWEQHNSEIIPKMLLENTQTNGKKTIITDQIALSTTIEQLKLKGIKFCPLPMPYHARWQRIYARMLPISKTKLFHAIGIFKNGYHRDDMNQSIAAYQARLRQHFDLALEKRLPGENSLTRIYLIVKYKLAVRDIVKMGKILKLLNTKYIQPALTE